MDQLKWKKIDNESLLLAISQGELLLKETVDTANYQTKKALSFLQASLGLLVGIIGYILGTRPGGILLLESILLALLLAVIIIYSFKAYRSYKIEPLGNCPSKIITKTNIDYAGKNVYKFLLYNTCRTIEESINTNQENNQLRARNLIFAEKVVQFGLPVLVIVPLLYWIAFRFLSACGAGHFLEGFGVFVCS